MAITTKYFSTAAVGGGTGVDWANAAALFSAGVWSTVISGHDFATTSLVCRIGPGTYTCGAALSTSTITTDPSAALPIILHGCDSSGNLLAPPDPNWVSPMSAWDDSGLPVINTTTNVATITLGTAQLYLLKFTASGRNGAVVSTAETLEWCVVENTTSNSSALAVSTINRPVNSVLSCTATTYDAVLSGFNSAINCRIEGNATGGGSGNRRGVSTAATVFLMDGCTVVNNVGEGIISTSANASQALIVTRCTVAANGAGGIKGTSTGSQIAYYATHNCMITGNGTAGIDGVSDACRWNVSNNRLRDNTTNIQGIGNYPTDLNNYVTDSDDATEYVGVGVDGDYRIKNTATIWGQGYGAGDQPASAGGGAAQLVNSRALVS